MIGFMLKNCDERKLNVESEFWGQSSFWIEVSVLIPICDVLIMHICIWKHSVWLGHGVWNSGGARGGIRPVLCRRKEWSWAWHDSFQVSKRNLISYVFVDLVYSTAFRIRFVKGKYYVHWFVFSFWFIYGKEGTFSMFCLIMLPTILPMVFTDPYLNTFSLLETGELGHFIAVWGSPWKICRLSTSLFINLWLDTRRRDIGASHYHTVCA